MTTADPFAVPSDSGGQPRPRGDAEDRADIPRDHYGRYLIPHMDGTKPATNKGFTRVSTTKSALSNTFGIQEWSKSRVVDGIGADPDLMEQAIRAHAMPSGTEKNATLRRIADDAFVVGGGKERSGLGTGFHQLTEDRNKGQTVDVPPEQVPDIDAYDRMLIDNHITILPKYLERVLMCPFNQGGTVDNIVRMWNPATEDWELLVADLKTGRSLDRAWLEIKIQLWSYANAYGMWTTTEIHRNDPKDPQKITGVDGFWSPMPRELRTDKALIFHVPLDGTAALYVVDLSGTERHVRAAVEAKRANAEARHGVRSVYTYRPEAFMVTPVYDMTSELLNPAVDQQVVDQQLAAKAAVERVAAMAAPLLTTDDGPKWNAEDGTPEQQAQLDNPKERLAVAAETLARAPQTDGEDKPLAPLAAAGKRGCGVCGRTGHKRGSKRCLGDADPLKTQGTDRETEDRASTFQGDPDPAEESSIATCNCLGDGDFHPVGSGGCLLPVDHLLNARQTAIDENPPPWCTMVHDCQWTSQHPDAPGQWVCSETGKPGKLAYKARQTQVTAESPLYGAPPANVWPVPPEYVVGNPPDMVLWAINNAETKADVLRIRQEALTAGIWKEAEHDAPALRHYRILTS